MLNAACLSPFPVPCHRYHLIQELFRGQLFQAIESRSKPALNFSLFWGGGDSVFSSSFLFYHFFAASSPARYSEATNMTTSLGSTCHAKHVIVKVFLNMLFLAVNFRRGGGKARGILHPAVRCKYFGRGKDTEKTKEKELVAPRRHL